MELLLKSRRLQNHHDKKLPSRKFEVLKNGVILFKNNTSNYYKWALQKFRSKKKTRKE